MNSDNYTFVGPPVHINKWVEAQNTAIPGWEYKVQDGVTGAIVPVFVADSVFGKDQVHTLVMHELDKLRSVHTLTSNGQ